MTTPPLHDNASRFTHALRFDMLPDAVVRDARRRLLDLFGVAAAGTSTRMSAIAREHALDCFAAGRMPARMRRRRSPSYRRAFRAPCV